MDEAILSNVEGHEHQSGAAAPVTTSGRARCAGPASPRDATSRPTERCHRVGSGPAHRATGPRPSLQDTLLSLAEVERLADEIAELAAHLDAATHRLLTLIRRLDEGGGWYTHGAMSCVQWLSWRIGLEPCAARDKVRVARALGSLPHIDEALRRGQVSYSKVRALTRVATPENEQSLLEMARSSTAAQLERICRGYRRALNGLLGTHPVDEAHRRWIRDSSTQDGMIRIEIQVTPEEAAVVRKAIELAMDRAWNERAPETEEEGASAAASGQTQGARVSAEWPAGSSEARVAAGEPAGSSEARASAEAPVGEAEPEGAAHPQPAPTASTSLQRPGPIRRVDAFIDVVESYLRSSPDDGRPPVEIVVHVEADSLADPASGEPGTLEDGSSIGPRTVQRLVCDSSVVTVVENANGTPLDIGRRRRTIPTALRRALRYRDRGCRFPGCESRRVDGHHVRPWLQGGETRLANLCSLCRTHHRYVHELGFRVEARSDGGFAFFNAAGHEIEAVPAALPLPRNPVAALRVAHRAAGVEIDGETSFPRWDGTPPDYDHIVCVLANKYPPVAG